jgi:transcriptional regulator with XRE-family HTH domain
MFDALLPPLYLQLRIKSGLSKTALASRLGVSRYTVANYESGVTRPDADWERRLIEIAGCSPPELALMVADQLADLIDRPVVILERQERKPDGAPTVLERADRTAREVKRFIPASMFRALRSSIFANRHLALLYKRQSADLDDLAADCRAAAGQHAPDRASHKGATGSIANGPVLASRTDGTPAARSHVKPQPKHKKGIAR